MIKRSDRIQKVVSIADSEERRECMELGKAQRALEDEISRLEELNEYRRGYAERTLPGASVSALRWQDYQHFLNRLDNAVNAQKQLIVNSEQNIDAHRRRWLVKRQRLDSLERVIERYRKAESAHGERLLQKALDDLPKGGALYDDEL
ncbi:MAG: flagellar export protein FliJ [Gammaproteobacteria bacterium]|nr:flagellar export protein FliJ [Gammaproteobacteria bacterium]MDH4313263.1 flagellar export protein FliJ [Gammaproteobacteria bacterium]MDH5212936.1 flagellar export protein FliJ [Gammaproteobacteria bacterium]MDH5500211.1 flagellar export protein FliJ [Gammaproteobacteria bacterium]